MMDPQSISPTERFPGVFRNLMTDSPGVGWLIVSPEWRILFANRTMEQWLSAAPLSLEDRPLTVVLPGIEETPLFLHLRHCMEARVCGTLEHALDPADGTRRLLFSRIEPVSEGVCLLSLPAGESRREDRMVEERLPEDCEFLESLKDMAFVADPGGRILYANPAASLRLGYPPEELLSLNLLDLHPADLRAEAATILAAMLAGGTEVCPLPLAARDGTLVPVETHAWPGTWRGSPCLFGLARSLSAEVEAQQCFERLFRHNPSPMALTTVSGLRFTDVNDAFMAITGYTHREVIGRTPVELGLYESSAALQAIADRIQREGRVADVELQLRRRNGERRSGLFSGEVIPSQGKDYFLTVMLDITERKRAEEELRRSEALLERLFDTMEEGMIFMSPDGGILKANRTAERILGIRRTDAGAGPLSFPDWRFFHEDGSPMPLGEMAGPRSMQQRLFLRNVVTGVERPDGTLLWIRVNSAPLMRKNGEIEGAISTFADITELILAERRLIASERKYSQLVENSHDIIFILNREGILTFASQSWMLLLGHPVEQVVWHPLAQFVHPVDAPGCLERLMQVIDTGRRQEGIEYRVRHLDGSWRRHASNAVPIWDENGAAAGLQATARDITEKRAEEERLLSGRPPSS